MAQTIYSKSKYSRYVGGWLLVPLLLFANNGVAQDTIKTNLLFVGDILLSRNVAVEYESHKASPWADLKPLFKQANFVAGNLEGAFGRANTSPKSVSGSPIFVIDSNKISLLRDAGFTAITLENNHALDVRILEIKTTAIAIRNGGLVPINYNFSPHFFTINNTVIALITINLVPSIDYSKNSLPSIEMAQKLRFASSLANLTIVSIHWGSELLSWPNKEQRFAAKWLIKNGADLIIGSHPHVIQPPEIIDGKPVFFSLGNHLFDQKYPATKEGLIAQITIQNGKFQCAGFLTHTKPNSFYPQIIDTLSYDFPAFELRQSSLKINQYILRPVSVQSNEQKNAQCNGQSNWESKTIFQAFCNNKMIWSTQPMALVTVNACHLDGTNDYLFALENHFSSLDSVTTIRPYIYSADAHGIYARWRGSALAYPLLDAQISSQNSSILCALHRGDSFLCPNPSDTTTRIVAYKWNGFGFSGLTDSTTCQCCKGLLDR